MRHDTSPGDVGHTSEVKKGKLMSVIRGMMSALWAVTEGTAGYDKNHGNRSTGD